MLDPVAFLRLVQTTDVERLRIQDSVISIEPNHGIGKLVGELRRIPADDPAEQQSAVPQLTVYQQEMDRIDIERSSRMPVLVSMLARKLIRRPGSLPGVV